MENQFNRHYNNDNNVTVHISATTNKKYKNKTKRAVNVGAISHLRNCVASGHTNHPTPTSCDNVALNTQPCSLKLVSVSMCGYK